jgi:hypothetical protein
MNKYAIPDRKTAIETAKRFAAGQSVRIMAEPLSLYGPGRSDFGYVGRVVRLDTLPGADILTGRVMVETDLIVHYQKTATRRGTRTYRTALSKRRTIAVWPWDIAK